VKAGIRKLQEERNFEGGMTVSLVYRPIAAAVPEIFVEKLGAAVEQVRGRFVGTKELG
jgi:hypothetical protein